MQVVVSDFLDYFDISYLTIGCILRRMAVRYTVYPRSRALFCVVSYYEMGQDLLDTQYMSRSSHSPSPIVFSLDIDIHTYKQMKK